MRIRVIDPEWEPLRAYAEANGITRAQATRELLTLSMNANATNALLIANARSFRHMMMKMAIQAAMKATAQMIEELRARAIVIGLSPEEIP